MTVLLSILLYLTVIVSPGAYYHAEIDAFEQQYEPEITAIQQDPDLTADILETYGPQTESIIFLDDEEAED